jgi:hypothetical protein
MKLPGVCSDELTVLMDGICADLQLEIWRTKWRVLKMVVSSNSVRISPRELLENRAATPKIALLPKQIDLGHGMPRQRSLDAASANIDSLLLNGVAEAL